MKPLPVEPVDLIERLRRVKPYCYLARGQSTQWYCEGEVQHAQGLEHVALAPTASACGHYDVVVAGRRDTPE